MLEFCHCRVVKFERKQTKINQFLKLLLEQKKEQENDDAIASETTETLLSNESIKLNPF